MHAAAVPVAVDGGALHGDTIGAALAQLRTLLVLRRGCLPSLATAEGLAVHAAIGCSSDAASFPIRTLTPAGPNPETLAVHPPAGDLRVEVVRVVLHALLELGLRHEPPMPRVQVRLVHGIVRVMGHLIRGLTERAPEVRQVAIDVVDRLDAWHVRPRQEHRQ
jgi:hypothetical protein